MPFEFDIKSGEFVEIKESTKKGILEFDAATLFIKGDKGDKGDPGESILGPPGKDGERGPPGKDGIGIQGRPGLDGKDGKDGKDAAPAKDGRGIASITEHSPGQALITYTDGKSQKLSIPAGKDGREVEMGKSSTHIQWRYKGEDKWRDLMLIPKARGGSGGGGASLDDLTGILVAGTNITLTPSAAGKLTVAASGGGGGHTIQEEGTPLTQRLNLNFVGSSVTVTDDAGNDATVVTISASGGVPQSNFSMVV